MASALRNVMEKMNLRPFSGEEEDASVDVYDDDLGFYDSDEYDDEYQDDMGANVVPMPNQRAAADLSRIVTVRPRHYGDDETLVVADSMRDGIPVIVHMGALEQNDQQSLFHFISGVVYVLGGHLQKVTSQVYLLSPAQVKIVNGEGEDLATRKR